MEARLNGSGPGGEPPQISIDRTDAETRIRFAGSLRIAQLSHWQLLAAPIDIRGRAVFDLSGVKALDTAGAWFLTRMQRRIETAGGSVRLEGAGRSQRALIDIVIENQPAEPAPPTAPVGLLHWLETVGEATAGAWDTLREMTGLLGQIVIRWLAVMLDPRRLRWTALVHHMGSAGLQAVPIIALMAFLIGVVMAFQGAVQLRAFGAEIFVVDLLAISILRELGVLLTAILVAGRSGSAFTAAIGSMKMREEIDAMRTLGLDPVGVLVLPRVLALLLTLPILAFIADVAGLLGGALMSWVNLGISPGLFLARLWEETDVWNFITGMVKAPFFAVTIALVGCFEGLKVEGSTESLGARTSRSVVEAIFLVIVLDALFSIFFAIVGV
jgi:phospholipid/cholesterol/gamma-HCH transport system permease protein